MEVWAGDEEDRGSRLRGVELGEPNGGEELPVKDTPGLLHLVVLFALGYCPYLPGDQFIISLLGSMISCDDSCSRTCSEVKSSLSEV